MIGTVSLSGPGINQQIAMYRYMNSTDPPDHKALINLCSSTTTSANEPPFSSHLLTKTIPSNLAQSSNTTQPSLDLISRPKPRIATFTTSFDLCHCANISTPRTPPRWPYSHRPVYRAAVLT